MNSSTSNSSFTPENIVSGSGVWAPGKTVREIEGHFHPENEPKDAVPISGTGGVPKVDFNPLHHGHSSSGTGSGLTGSHGTGSGLTGSQGTGSGLTGSHGTGSGLTGDNTHHSSTTGSGLAGSHQDSTHHNNKDGKPGVVEKVKDAVSGNKSGSDYDSNRDHHTDNATGLTGQTGRTGHSDYTGTTAAPVGTTGSSSTATHGATHGISDRAERDLQSSSGHGQLGHSTGAPIAGTGAGATGAGLTGAAARTDESGGSGIATHLRNEANTRAHGQTGDVTTGRTGDTTTGRTGDAPASNAMSGATTHDSTTAGHGTTGHNTTGHSSSTHNNNTTTSGTDSPKKEGFLAKVKNALH